MGDRPIVDDGVLAKLAALTNIPIPTPIGFDSCIRATVNELRRGMAAQQAQARRTAVLSALDEYQAAIQKVGELLVSNDCGQTLAQENAKVAVQACLSRMKSDHLAEFMDGGLSVLGDLELAIEDVKPGIKEAFNAKGHPHGTHVGKTAVNQFVFSLIYMIKSFGGHVATSRTMELSPNHLSKSLDALRDSLPEGFPLSDTFLRTIEDAGRKANADIAKLTSKSPNYR